ncbi:olfactory receptor 1L1-like [Suricata suricatta]|uniref:olfactory receptor 1L1-like n=1 Tax=Suricata suricatta TaxID=37032 RepID=UPI0011560575|nr:olfactory receptor 1L1-like [Suricata suricatta]
MSRGNQSHITEFLLLGLNSDPKHRGWLFASFLAMYLVNVAGNSVIIAAIRGDTRLHTPMYFFLSNLSLVDICLSCSDTSINELLAFTEGSFVIMSPFILIIVSYVYITRAVLRVPSGGGRYKVFSTCGSHLTVVALFYGTAISVYIRPSSTYSVTKDSVVTVIYTVVIPMLNPFIYSLRNKDMKQALRKLTRRKE